MGIVGSGFMGGVHSRAARASGPDVLGVVTSRPDICGARPDGLPRFADGPRAARLCDAVLAAAANDAAWVDVHPARQESS